MTVSTIKKRNTMQRDLLHPPVHYTVEPALPTPASVLPQFALDYASDVIGNSRIVHADCLEWLGAIPQNSLHAIVTDPPYGVKEYDFDQLEKRESGQGGIWRIPPAFDGHVRSPLPRFTALNDKERAGLQRFFREWSLLAGRALRPGAHVFLASNAFLSQFVFAALIDGGLEFRGELIRLVRTLRGGDRPKNAEEAYPDVSSLPRGCYEPWGIFRKPLLPKMKVSDCLREYQTGGLRRGLDGNPFTDVLLSERTPKRERAIATHPSLKPQSFLRQVVYVALPLGVGTIADPFMGSGSTVAAAEAMGVQCVGVERFKNYYDSSKAAIVQLASLPTVTKPRQVLDAVLATEGEESASQQRLFNDYRNFVDMAGAGG